VRLTLRLRLTLLYGACFLVAGAVLLAITYALVAQTVPGANQQSIAIRAVAGRAQVGAPGLELTATRTLRQALTLPAGLPPGLVNVVSKLRGEAQVQVTKARSAQLDALLTKSAIALVIMAFVSIALGWLMAGRALAPLRTMSARARRITEHNLHERLALEPRDDELGELARTFDGLLARLQRAFESQRRFVANASHELRTPITLERALVEVALADPHASVDSLRDCCARVLAAGEEQERLIEALLTLARSQGGIEARERVDLGALTGELAAQRRAAGAQQQLRLSLAPAAVAGDRALLERLVANLLDNALAYNLPAGGWVALGTAVEGESPVLRIANSGPVVPAERLDELFEPFRRFEGERITGGRGLGLGLSIVSAIAVAHGATLSASARTEGGLEVVVRFAPVRV
jgi:signal transduction histidine kinase